MLTSSSNVVIFGAFFIDDYCISHVSAERRRCHRIQFKNPESRFGESIRNHVKCLNCVKPFEYVLKPLQNMSNMLKS